LQPVASIALAYFLYAEILSPLQGLGGAMVIGGILLMQWWQTRRR
jgi:drug/metabolite transporter (DMT)-like permease